MLITNSIAKLIICLTKAMLLSGYPLRPEIAHLHRRKYDYLRVLEPAHYYYDYYVADKQQHHLDVHAVEFVPKNDSGDSGNGSSSSSEEESSSGSEAGE